MEEPRVQGAVLQREQAGGMFAGAILAVLFLVLDGLSFGWHVVPIATRVVWAVAMVAAGGVMLRASPRYASTVVLVIGAISTLSFVIVVAWTGGLSGPYALWLACFPCTLAPYSRRATLVSAVVALGGAVWVGWGIPFLPRYLFGFVLSGGLAVYTAVMFHGLRRKERQLERDRHESREKLEASERRRERSERLALVGQLAAGVAHEINNPLSYVKANLAYLSDEGPTLPENERIGLHGEIGEGLGRIAQIVADLKSFARDPSETSSVNDVNPLVASAVRLAGMRGRSAGTSLKVTESMGAAKALVNPQRLEQVILNLVLNGIDAAELRPDRSGHVDVRVTASPEGVVIDVEDDGPGMPPKVQSRLFEPFFTTKPVGKGTGLGLALSMEFVQQMGGTIAVRSAPGAGACFSVRLPALCAEEVPATQPEARPGRYDGRPLLTANR